MRKEETPGWRGSLLSAMCPLAFPRSPAAENPNEVRRRIRARSRADHGAFEAHSGQGSAPGAGTIRTRTSRARTEARPPAPALPIFTSAPARCASISIRRASQVVGKRQHHEYEEREHAPGRRSRRRSTGWRVRKAISGAIRTPARRSLSRETIQHVLVLERRAQRSRRTRTSLGCARWSLGA